MTTQLPARPQCGAGRRRWQGNFPPADGGSTIRLSLRKGKGEQRLMKVVDAPNLREQLCWHILI